MANDLNSQRPAFTFAVDIASGDTSEAGEDHDLPKNQQTSRLLQCRCASAWKFLRRAILLPRH